MVWRTPQEVFDPRCTVHTVKHGGGNVKCWGSLSSSAVGNLVFIDGNMTGEVYRNILQRNLFESVKKLNVETELGFATWQWPETQSPYSNEMAGWQRS